MIEIEQFNEILNSLKINASCVNYKSIDNYHFYDLHLNPRTTIKSVDRYGDEIALLLKIHTRPNISLLRDQGIIRLEFANPRKDKLSLIDLFDSLPKEGNIPCILGQSVEGEKVWMDLEQNPHLLIAGTTGSGKSTLLHNIIANVLQYSSANLFLVDPKCVEFSKYEKLANIYYTYDDTIYLLDKLISIMNSRYSLMRQGYSGFDPIVVIIDEYANLVYQDYEGEFQKKLCLLAQKSRASKIHMVIATQRPSSVVVSGVIKASFPARICCRVASKLESRIVLDSNGAENLFGNGDALLKDNTRNLQRFQVAYTDSNEVSEIY